MMKRIFSKRYLKDSKIFEREMERNVVTGCKEILPGDYGRYGYPDGSGAAADRRKFQELAVKGPLKLKIWKRIRSKKSGSFRFTYGVVLNSQTVKHAMVEVEQRH